MGSPAASQPAADEPPAFTSQLQGREEKAVGAGRPPQSHIQTNRTGRHETPGSSSPALLPAVGRLAVVCVFVNSAACWRTKRRASLVAAAVRGAVAGVAGGSRPSARSPRSLTAPLLVLSCVDAGLTSQGLRLTFPTFLMETPCRFVSPQLEARAQERCPRAGAPFQGAFPHVTCSYFQERETCDNSQTPKISILLSKPTLLLMQNIMCATENRYRNFVGVLSPCEKASLHCN